MNDADKKARLAAALRENLHKRKAQARGANEAPGSGPDEKDAPSD